jgi:hypothetical protein
MQEKRQFFAFTDGSDNYPPHLNLAGNIPAAKAEASEVQKSTLSPIDIFNKMRLLQLASLLPTLMPQSFILKPVVAIGGVAAGVATDVWFGKMGTPDAGVRLEDVENYNRKMRAKWFHKDIFDLPNVGDLEDWYSDARFAQQHFTGTNPTTIERASDQWITHFATAAKDPADKKAQEIIVVLANSLRQSLYMQDYSYFRKAAGMDKSAVIKCEFDETYKEGGKTKTRKGYRYGCASVCLFYLNDAGRLQPLAIVIDWRGSADESVTIYNRELIKRDPDLASVGAEADKDGRTVDEAHDWAWRYGEYTANSTNALTDVM